MLRLPVAGEVVASEQATSLQRSRAGGVSGVTSVVSSMARISRLISHEIGAFFTFASVAKIPRHRFKRLLKLVKHSYHLKVGTPKEKPWIEE